MSDDLHDQLRSLERSNRRWRSIALSLAVALGIALMYGTVLGRAARSRVAAEYERAVQAERIARLIAEEMALEARHAKQAAKEAEAQLRRPAP